MAEVVVMRLQDMGASIRLASVSSILGHDPVPVGAETTVVLHLAALGVDLPVEEGIRIEARVHAIGVVALRARFEVDAPLADLGDAPLPDLRGRPLRDHLADLAAAIVAETGPARHDPYEVEVAPEWYKVYLVPEAASPGEGAAVARLITGRPEDSPERLEAALRHRFLHRADAAVVPGGDHAVVFDPQRQWDDLLDTMEVANLQLLEFRAYDAYLDQRLEEAFARIDSLWSARGIWRSARATLRDIAQVRLEMTRLLDSLLDTGKVFGDWHTSELHRRLHERFHLRAWQEAVAGKVRALEDMFALAQEETNHRRSLTLEWMIVLLFVIDLTTIILGV